MFFEKKFLVSFARMDAVLKSGLWEEDDLRFYKQEKACILLPANVTLSEHGIAMLDRLLSAISIAPTDRRYIYATGQNSEVPQNCSLALIFSDDKEQLPEKTTANNGETKVYTFPSIDAILADKELKRTIWNLLKD